MKKITLTESELQELLRQQRELCAEYLEYDLQDKPYRLAQMVNYAPSPLLPTEEKEDDYVPSDNKNKGASLASHSCTIGNSIQQNEK